MGVTAALRNVRRRPGTAVVRGFAVASVVANVLIVVTGGAVRLTGSGLGCPTWPRCTEDSLVNTSEYGVHGYIEFGNRLLTWVLAILALATLVAVLRARPKRRDWRRPAVLLFLGIPAQAVLGGITVLTHLNPWVVMGHFLLSMALIALGVLLVRRTGEHEAPERLLVPAPLYRLAQSLLVVLAAVLYLGTVVTGSGPHAGDAAAPRTGLDPRAVSMLHADAVWVLIGLSVALRVALAAVDAPRSARRAASVLLLVEAAQGVVGYAQYFLHLPVVLVAVHLLGAGAMVVAATHVVVLLRHRSDASLPVQSVPIGTPPTATVGR